MSWNNLLLKLKLERTGLVPGESQVSGHVGEIEIESAAFEITTPAAAVALDREQLAVDDASPAARFQAARNLVGNRLAGNRSVNRAAFSALKVAKSFDSSSTALLKALSSQEIITEAVFLALRRSELGGKVKMMPWLRIALRKATVKSIELKTTASGTGQLVSEDVVFDFGEIDVEYTPERSPGTMRFSHARSGL